MSDLETLGGKLLDAVQEWVSFVEQHNYNDPEDALFPAEQIQLEELLADPAAALVLVDTALRKVRITSRHNRSTDHRLQSAIRNSMNAIRRLVRYGTSVPLLMPHQIQEVRTRRVLDYGPVDRGLVARATVCRSCGEKMPKGTEVLAFPWDFGGSGSFTTTNAAIHAVPCQSKIAEVDSPR